jgi:predicted transcriptional regulator
MPPKVTQLTEQEIRRIAQQEARTINAQDAIRIQQAIDTSVEANESASRAEATVSRIELTSMLCGKSLIHVYKNFLRALERLTLNRKSF